jgi:hypothetical protein
LAMPLSDFQVSMSIFWIAKFCMTELKKNVTKPPKKWVWQRIPWQVGK